MTPAIKLLRANDVEHQVHAYKHSSAASSYGLEAAQALKLPPQRVFKTIVLNSVNVGFCVGIVPVSTSLNLKAMADAIGDKKVSLADKNKVQSTTGYVIGGVSPLAQKKALRTVLDESAFLYDTVFVSAGKRGLDVELSPDALRSHCSASVAKIAESH